MTETYLGSCHTSVVGFFFTKILSQKRSIVDVFQGPKYATEVWTVKFCFERLEMYSELIRTFTMDFYCENS